MNMRRTVLLLILAAIIAASAPSCINQAAGIPGKDTKYISESLDSIKIKWNRFHELGIYDSLIICTKPFLQTSISTHDTISVLYAGLRTAQAYLFLDNNDSASHYIAMVRQYDHDIENNPDIDLLTTYNNILGVYYLKIEMDYSQALEHFIKNYEYSKTLQDTAGTITSLINIAGIHLTRNDKTGMRFAKEAYCLADNDNVAPFLKCHTALMMGEMTCLDQDYDNASVYMDAALNTAKKNNLKSLYPMIYATYGNIYRTSAPYKAEPYFKEALSWADNAEPTFLMTLYYNYSDFLQHEGKNIEALALTKEGLKISSSTGSLIARGELLHQLSDLYSIMGDSDSALIYYKQYVTFHDSINLTTKEQEFGRMLLQLQDAEHINMIQAKEVALLKANKRTMAAAFVISIIAILLILFYVLYKRQRLLYKTLVAQHQQYLQRIKKEEENSRLPKDSSRILFDRLESMMKNDRIYRQKGISLEKAAEMLESNRTYLSKAINTFAQTSFNGYINTYRINDAIEMMSRPGEDIPLKQMADILGYNSVSVFCRTFQRETGCPPGRYRKEIAAK